MASETAHAPHSVDNLLPEPGPNGEQLVRSNAPSVVAFDKSVDDSLKLDSHDLKLDGDNLVVVGKLLSGRRTHLTPSKS